MNDITTEADIGMLVGNEARDNMSMNDKIADIIAEHWCSLTGNIDQHDMSDAILEALPDMIAPLVWVNGFATCPVTKDRYSADWYDAGDSCTALLINGTFDCGDMPMKDLKAVADTKRRAAIMAAFTGETQAT
jgi:hypothetical protein